MKKRLTAVAVLASVLVSALLTSAPASAKNKCGAVYFERTGVTSARLLQSCDQGTQVMYHVRCLLPGGNQQYARYFAQSQSAVTNVRCGNGSPILSASYELS